MERTGLEVVLCDIAVSPPLSLSLSIYIYASSCSNSDDLSNSRRFYI